MEIKIYNVETNEIVARYNGSTNRECENWAENQGYDEDLYGWSYLDDDVIENYE
jgi:hypothetical protein